VDFLESSKTGKPMKILIADRNSDSGILHSVDQEPQIGKSQTVDDLLALLAQGEKDVLEGRTTCQDEVFDRLIDKMKTATR
jgi:hypothetical protein